MNRESGSVITTVSGDNVEIDQSAVRSVDAERVELRQAAAQNVRGETLEVAESAMLSVRATDVRMDDCAVRPRVRRAGVDARQRGDARVRATRRTVTQGT